MKKMKSLMLLVATILMLAVVFCVNASAAEWIDIDGNAQYTFDEETAVMIIKGEGKLNCSYFSKICPDHYAPLDDVFGCTCEKNVENRDPSDEEDPGRVAASKTKTLIIQEGITAVDVRAFNGFTDLEVAILPQSLTEIPAGAFDGLKKLNTVTLSYSTTSIDEMAFADCNSLRNIYLPETVKTIAKSAFRGCDKNSIRIPASIKNADELEFFGGKTKLEVYYREGNKVGFYLVGPGIGYGSRKELYRYDKATKKYTLVAVTEKDICNITLDDLDLGKTYYFVARAYQETYTGKLYYDVSDLLTVEMPPVKPSKVTATQTDSSITLSWSKSPTATGYRIYLANGVRSWDVAVSSTTATTYTLKGLESGKKYHYAVRPYVKTADGEVLWGEYTDIYAFTKPTTVTAKATSPSKGKINLTWNNVSGDVDGYRVYYKVGNGAYKIYKNYTSAQKLTFSNLKSGTKCTFAVRAGIKTSNGIVWSTYKESAVTVK